MSTTQDSILALVRDQGLIPPMDLDAHGLPRVSLTRPVRRGRLARVGRGLYAPPDRPVSEHSTLAESVVQLFEEVSSLMLAEADAETRFRLRARRGAGKEARGLELLDKATNQDSKR